MKRQFNSTDIPMLLVLCLITVAARGANPSALLQVAEDPKLPRVLIIGDSISMGFTPPLREKFKNKANVHHPPENCRSSRQTAQRIDQYLGKKPWDVIQFNCGIHDVTYLNAAGTVATPEQGGKVQVPLDEYRANLEKIVSRLEQTDAVIIWCTTTPVTKVVKFRLTDDIARYNEAAKEIMQRHGIQITDLNASILKQETPSWRSDGVHFTADGYQESADFVAPAIEKALSDARKPARP